MLKSVDRGVTWTMASHGIFNSKVVALHIADAKGDHVYAAVDGGVYESVNGAASWAFVNGSEAWGGCNCFKNGTIDGAPHTLVGCGVGIVNRPVAGGGAWAIIPAWGVTRGGFFSVSDGLGHTSVVAYCTGLVQIATIVNRTYMEIAQQNYSCQQTCIDPNDAHRWMWTHPPSSMITTDGGKSVVNLNHSNIWHCGIDRRGALYTAAMGGAYRSFDNGATWKAYYDVRVSRRTNATRDRVPHDYQRLVTDFGGPTGVAFPSDQVEHTPAPPRKFLPHPLL